MSYSALLKATNDVVANFVALPTNLLTPKDHGVELSPNPPAHWGGDLYVSITPGPIFRGPSDIPNAAIDRVFSVNLTLTQRIAYFAEDVHEKVILNESQTIELLSEQLQRVMYEQRFFLQEKANQYLQSSYCTFVEPPLFASATGIAFTPPGWFHEDEDEYRDRYNPAEHGVFITLTFDRCRRMSHDTYRQISP